MCSESSFSSRDFTTAWEKSFPATRIFFFLEQTKGPHDVGGLNGTQVGTADLRLLRQLFLGHPLHFSQAGNRQAKFDESISIAEFHFLAHPLLQLCSVLLVSSDFILLGNVDNSDISGVAARLSRLPADHNLCRISKEKKK